MNVEMLLSELGPGYAVGDSLMSFDPLLAYDNYESVPVDFNVNFGVYGSNYSGGGRIGTLRLGEKTSLSFNLNNLPDTPKGIKYNLINLGGMAVAHQDVTMKIKVENARIVLPNKTLSLKGLNKTYDTTAYFSELPYQGSSWLYGGLTDQRLSLTDTKTLKQGTFQADVTLLAANGPNKVDYYYSLNGNPPQPTSEWFAYLKKQGFHSIRFQVTWLNHTNDKTYKIDKAWLDRVEQTVNLALEQGLYASINLNWDMCPHLYPTFTSGLTDDQIAALPNGGHGWLTLDGDANVEKRFASVWKQIANRFKDYDEYLIFESINEPMYHNDTAPDFSLEKVCENLNRLNQIFVDTVRETGGNNAKRFLYASPYFQRGSVAALSNFKMPADTAQHTLVAINRYYSDYNAENEWSDIYGPIKEYLVDKGIGVVFTEFGVPSYEASKSKRIAWVKEELAQAIALGIPVTWYAGNYGNFAGHPLEKEPGFCLYNPYTMKPVFPEAINLLMGK
jgi:aryl-phospho-beta-D-glucosidase BglC (GH1 family)